MGAGAGEKQFSNLARVFVATSEIESTQWSHIRLAICLLEGENVIIAIFKFYKKRFPIQVIHASAHKLIANTLNPKSSKLYPLLFSLK